MNLKAKVEIFEKVFEYYHTNPLPEGVDKYAFLGGYFEELCRSMLEELRQIVK